MTGGILDVLDGGMNILGVREFAKAPGVPETPLPRRSSTDPVNDTPTTTTQRQLSSGSTGAQDITGKGTTVGGDTATTIKQPVGGDVATGTTLKGGAADIAASDAAMPPPMVEPGPSSAGEPAGVNAAAHTPVSTKSVDQMTPGHGSKSSAPTTQVPTSEIAKAPTPHEGSTLPPVETPKGDVLMGEPSRPRYRAQQLQQQHTRRPSLPDAAPEPAKPSAVPSTETPVSEPAPGAVPPTTPKAQMGTGDVARAKVVQSGGTPAAGMHADVGNAVDAATAGTGTAGRTPVGPEELGGAPRRPEVDDPGLPSPQRLRPEPSLEESAPRRRGRRGCPPRSSTAATSTQPTTCPTWCRKPGSAARGRRAESRPLGRGAGARRCREAPDRSARLDRRAEQHSYRRPPLDRGSPRDAEQWTSPRGRAGRSRTSASTERR